MYIVRRCFLNSEKKMMKFTVKVCCENKYFSSNWMKGNLNVVSQLYPIKKQQMECISYSKLLNGCCALLTKVMTVIVALHNGDETTTLICMRTFTPKSLFCWAISEVKFLCT